MKQEVIDEAVRSGRSLVYHYIGGIFSISNEVECTDWHLSSWPYDFEYVGAVETSNPEEAFRCTQDPQIGRSTMAGDLVRTPDGVWWLCLRFGWHNVTPIMEERIRRSA